MGGSNWPHGRPIHQHPDPAFSDSRQRPHPAHALPALLDEILPTDPARETRNRRQTDQPPTGPVARGLQDSVGYGMANPAAVPGVTILGKTGTASDVRETWTHGWFTGAIPGRMVIVIYVPHGDGGTAASLAQKFFQLVAGEGPR